MAWKFNPFTSALDIVPTSSSGLSGLVASGVLFASSATTAATDASNFYFNNTTDEVGAGVKLTFPTSGTAIATTTYTIGRDNTATNQLYFNVPTSAGMRWAINGSNFMAANSSGLVAIGGAPGGTARLDVTGIMYQHGGVFYTDSITAYNGGLTHLTIGAGLTAITLRTVSPANDATLTVVQSATSSGVPGMVRFTSGAHTGMTASTEVNGILFDLSATKQWATGAIATQREFLIKAPTYSAVAASTIASSATFAVTDAPTAGTNVTLTNAYALWVQAGLSKFDGVFWPNSGQKIKRTASAAGGYTVLLTDYIIGKTGITGGGDTVTLPSAVTASGYIFVVKDESGNANVNNITVSATAGNINGAATYVINTNYGSVRVYSDGANWFTF